MDDIPDKGDAFVIVELVFDKGTKKETRKLFYAKVESKNIIQDTVHVKFLRQNESVFTKDYVFPTVEDEMEVKRDRIVQLVHPTRIFRESYTFLFILK